MHPSNRVEHVRTAYAFIRSKKMTPAERCGMWIVRNLVMSLPDGDLWDAHARTLEAFVRLIQEEKAARR